MYQNGNKSFCNEADQIHTHYVCAPDVYTPSIYTCSIYMWSRKQRKEDATPSAPCFLLKSDVWRTPDGGADMEQCASSSFFSLVFECRIGQHLKKTTLVRDTFFFSIYEVKKTTKVANSFASQQFNSHWCPIHKNTPILHQTGFYDLSIWVYNTQQDNSAVVQSCSILVLRNTAINITYWSLTRRFTTQTLLYFLL